MAQHKLQSFASLALSWQELSCWSLATGWPTARPISRTNSAEIITRIGAEQILMMMIAKLIILLDVCLIDAYVGCDGKWALEWDWDWLDLAAEFVGVCVFVDVLFILLMRWILVGLLVFISIEIVIAGCQSVIILDCFFDGLDGHHVGGSCLLRRLLSSYIHSYLLSAAAMLLACPSILAWC